MEEFEQQLINNRRDDIYTFNNKPEFNKIRELYKLHFDLIEDNIQKFGHKLAIEDISLLDSALTQIILDNALLLKEINRAINTQELTLEGIR